MNAAPAQNDADRFGQSVQALGGVQRGTFVGPNTPVECACVNEHVWYTTLYKLNQGRGQCKLCPQ
jgi:hypothetical protein